MADFSLDNEIDATVSADGSALKTRRWIFRNLSDRPLDLGSFSVWFEITDRHAQVQGAVDSLGRTIRCEPCLKPEGYLRITCYFDKIVEANSTYVIQSVYRQPTYFLYLFESRRWLVDEWFARTAIDASPYVQQEPERWSYTLQVADPRPMVLGLFRNPFKALYVDTNLQRPIMDESGGATIHWEMNLAPSERSEKLYVLYGTRWRPSIVGAAGALGIGAGGTAIWSGMQAVSRIFH